MEKDKQDIRNTDSIDSVRPEPGQGRSTMLYLFCLFVLGFALYSHILKSPFVLDDADNITRNAHIRMTEISWDALKDAAFKSLRQHRPLANVTFALNYYLGGYNTFGYHIFNILIHLACGAIVFFLFRITLRLDGPAIKRRWISVDHIAFFGAVLWLVHPLQIQAVTYIVQRMTALMALFYLLSLLFYAKARYRQTRFSRLAIEGSLAQAGATPAGTLNFKTLALYIGALICGLLSAGSKENAAMLPCFIFLYEWFFIQNLDIGWLKRRSGVILLIVVLLGATAYFVFDGHPIEKLLMRYDGRDFSMTQRVLTQFRVVLFYISLMLFPHPSRLNLDHDFSLSRGLLTPVDTLPAMMCVVGLLVMSAWIARRERLVSFAILWFLGNLLIESSIIPLELVFEHRLYLPSVFLLLAFVMLCVRGMAFRKVVVVILGAICVILAAWTYERNTLWRDTITLYRDCVQKSPDKARPHILLGTALMRAGRYRQSIVQFRNALAIDPTIIQLHNNMGISLVSLGDYEAGIAHFKKALELNPDMVEAAANLKKALNLQAAGVKAETEKQPDAAAVQ